jgi:hypothetical protein
MAKGKDLCDQFSVIQLFSQATVEKQKQKQILRFAKDDN